MRGKRPGEASRAEESSIGKRAEGRRGSVGAQGKKEGVAATGVKLRLGESLGSNGPQKDEEIELIRRGQVDSAEGERRS